ncbi:hypothetical protein M2427_006517 [Bradyrhizobium sp. BR13661]|nr:hypothetical protein [Bradyrhizobium sp. BR13661]
MVGQTDTAESNDLLLAAEGRELKIPWRLFAVDDVYRYASDGHFVPLCASRYQLCRQLRLDVT